MTNRRRRRILRKCIFSVRTGASGETNVACDASAGAALGADRGSNPALREPSYAFCFTPLSTAARRSGSAKPQNAPTRDRGGPRKGRDETVAERLCRAIASTAGKRRARNGDAGHAAEKPEHVKHAGGLADLPPGHRVQLADENQRLIEAVFRELHSQKTHAVRINAAGRPWLNQSFIAISASFEMVFMLRAVPNLAAGIFSLEWPMPLP
jgi:hypothetical protein